MPNAKERSIDKADANHKQFVEEYIANGRNGKQAYKKFHPNVTDRTAEVTASRLLRKVEVSAYLDQREQELRVKYRLTTDDVIKSMSQSLHFDPRKLFDENGRLKKITELDDDTMAALAGLEVTEIIGGGEDGKPTICTRKVKWLDKNTVREQVMKHLGMFAKNKDPTPQPGNVKMDVKLSPSEAYLRMLRKA
jgi:phage terminase small subunit